MPRQTHVAECERAREGLGRGLGDLAEQRAAHPRQHEAQPKTGDRPLERARPRERLRHHQADDHAGEQAHNDGGDQRDRIRELPLLGEPGGRVAGDRRDATRREVEHFRRAIHDHDTQPDQGVQGADDEPVEDKLHGLCGGHRISRTAVKPP